MPKPKKVDEDYVKAYPDIEELFPLKRTRIYSSDNALPPNVVGEGYVLVDATGRQITDVLPVGVADYILAAMEEYRKQKYVPSGHAGRLLCKIVIPINPVTKKNQMQIIRLRNGRHSIIPSARYKRYIGDVRKLGNTIYTNPYRGKLPIDKPVEIECHYYRATRHRVDITNLESAIMDVLVGIGCITDDDWTHVISTDGSRVFYDKENPRTEIYIRSWITDEN